MSMFYGYFPVEKIESCEDAIAIVESLFQGQVNRDDLFYERSFTNFEVVRDGRKIWVNTLMNVSFASDPRNFIRVRLDGTQAELIKELTQKAVEQAGFYGDNSKEFLDSQGHTVFEVKDGTTSIALSVGEISSRLRMANPEIELPQNTTNETYIELFKEHLGIELTMGEANHFMLPIPVQDTAKGC